MVIIAKTIKTLPTANLMLFFFRGLWNFLISIALLKYANDQKKDFTFFSNIQKISVIHKIIVWFQKDGEYNFN